MKQLIFAVLLASIFCSVIFPHEQKVLLRWNYPGTLIYQNDIYGGDDIAFTIPITENFFQLPVDSIPRTYKKLSAPQKNYLVLKNSGKDTIDVKIIVAEYEKTPDMSDSSYYIMKMYYEMVPVQLRAEINEAGENLSFYLEKESKNAINTLFQLPKDSVKVGDSWQVNVYPLNTKGPFIKEKAKRQAEAKLISITKNEKGEDIAEVRTYIMEYVEGNFQNPYNGEYIPIKMEIVTILFRLININKGCLEDLVLTSEMHNTGFFKYDTFTHSHLSIARDVPQKILEME